jgi:hypothetical protein
MERRQLKLGLIEIGVGIIIFISALELRNILLVSEATELFIFLIKVVSYIMILVGFITVIMSLIPEIKHPKPKIKVESNNEEKKVIWEKKDK